MSDMSEWFDVAAADDIPEGGYKVVDVDDAAVAVFRLDGGYYAIENVCTHDGGTLASAFRTCKEPVFFAQGNRPNTVFDRIVVDG